jgi:hypothetical protein
MMMKGKLQTEKAPAENTPEFKKSGGTSSGPVTEAALPLESVARMLSILELRDDPNMDKSFARNTQTIRELEALPQKAESKFLGILAKCKISGCDVHALDSNLNIVSHFRQHEQINDEFKKARPLAAVLPDTIIAVLVYSDHLSYLYSNGKLEVCHEK